MKTIIIIKLIINLIQINILIIHNNNTNNNKHNNTHDTNNKNLKKQKLKTIIIHIIINVMQTQIIQIIIFKTKQTILMHIIIQLILIIHNSLNQIMIIQKHIIWMRIETDNNKLIINRKQQTKQYIYIYIKAWSNNNNNTNNNALTQINKTNNI